MALSGEPAKTESQSFAFAEKLGSIQGMLESPLHKSGKSEETIINTIDQWPS